MKITVGRLKRFIRETIKDDCWAGSHPDETYEQQLIDDPVMSKDSVYVPDDIKSDIKRWTKAMKLSK